MRAAGIIASLLLMSFASVYGQATNQEVRVSYVAGNNVYLTAGRSSGVFPGDTLLVRTTSGEIHRIEVLSAMSDRSVLQYIGPSFGLQTGDVITIAREGATVDEFADDVLQVELAPEDVLEVEMFEPESTDFISASSSLDVEGRLLLGVNTLRSETESFLTPGVTSSRTYVTPNAMLWMDVSGLPNELEFRVRMRSEYRHVSGGRSSSPTTSIRTYELSLARELGDMTVRFGRFSSRYVPTGGYWDGLEVVENDGDLAYGVSAGFLPVRSNEQISFDLPKAALFGRYSIRSEQVTNRFELYYMEIRPTNNLLTRRHLGVRHRLNWSTINAYNRVEVDRDPETGHFVFTRLSGRLSSAITSALEVHGRYDVRQPYSIYRSIQVISYRRDQINTGLSYRFGRAALSTDFVWNYAYDLGIGRSLDGRSLTGSASLSRSRGVGMFASGSYWWSEFGASMYGSFSLSRSMGKVSTRLSYQVSGSTRFDTNLTTHALSAQAAVPIGSRIRSTSKFRVQFGEFVTSTAFETNVSIRL